MAARWRSESSRGTLSKFPRADAGISLKLGPAIFQNGREELFEQRVLESTRLALLDEALKCDGGGQLLSDGAQRRKSYAGRK